MKISIRKHKGSSGYDILKNGRKIDEETSKDKALGAKNFYKNYYKEMRKKKKSKGVLDLI